MDERFDLLIVFVDGSCRRIDGVQDYGFNSNELFQFTKNGYRGFIPKEQVRYFGRADLYGAE